MASRFVVIFIKPNDLRYDKTNIVHLQENIQNSPPSKKLFHSAAPRGIIFSRVENFEYSLVNVQYLYNIHDLLDLITKILPSYSCLPIWT